MIISRYAVASTSDDYNLARKLIRKEGLQRQQLGFPLVMAFDDKGLAGLISTDIKDDMVVAGPMILSSRHRGNPFALIQMLEVYEAVMRGLGITSFVFWADKGGFLHGCLSRGLPELKSYAEEGDRVFYLWHLVEGRQNPDRDFRAIFANLMQEQTDGRQQGQRSTADA